MLTGGSLKGTGRTSRADPVKKAIPSDQPLYQMLIALQFVFLNSQHSKPLRQSEVFLRCSFVNTYLDRLPGFFGVLPCDLGSQVLYNLSINFRCRSHKFYRRNIWIETSRSGSQRRNVRRASGSNLQTPFKLRHSGRIGSCWVIGRLRGS
jgi:hypothetical protein